MGINIKRADTVDVVRQLAEVTGLSLTDAIHAAAVGELRNRGHHPKLSLQRRAEIDAWLREVDARPRTDARTLKEIEAEMYDDNGNLR